MSQRAGQCRRPGAASQDQGNPLPTPQPPVRPERDIPGGQGATRRVPVAFDNSAPGRRGWGSHTTNTPPKCCVLVLMPSTLVQLRCRAVGLRMNNRAKFIVPDLHTGSQGEHLIS